VLHVYLTLIIFFSEISEPTHNAHDPNRHDEGWKEDPDALSSSAESEAEAESSAVSFNLSFAASILAILGAYLF